MSLLGVCGSPWRTTTVDGSRAPSARKHRSPLPEDQSRLPLTALGPSGRRPDHIAWRWTCTGSDRRWCPPNPPRGANKHISYRDVDLTQGEQRKTDTSARCRPRSRSAGRVAPCTRAPAPSRGEVATEGMGWSGSEGSVERRTDPTGTMCDTSSLLPRWSVTVRRVALSPKTFHRRIRGAGTRTAR